MGVARGRRIPPRAHRAESHHRHRNRQHHRARLLGLFRQARRRRAVRRGAGAGASRRVEVSGALRYDHFSDVGNSYTPKVGVKWNPTARTGPAQHLRQGLPRAERGRKRRRRPGRVLHRDRPGALRARRGGGLQPGVDRHHHLAQPGAQSRSARRAGRSARSGIRCRAPAFRSTSGRSSARTRSTRSRPTRPSRPAISRATRPPPPPSRAIRAPSRRCWRATSTRPRPRCAASTSMRAPRSKLGSGRGRLAMDAKWTHLFKWLRTEQDGSRAISPAPTATATSPTASARRTTGSTWAPPGTWRRGACRPRSTTARR